MTDIRQFLAAAAPEPAHRFDAAAFVARATRSPWQRWLAWGAGLMTLAGAGIGAGALAPGHGGEQTVHQLPAPQRVDVPRPDAVATGLPAPANVLDARDRVDAATASGSGGSAAAAALAPRPGASSASGAGTSPQVSASGGADDRPEGCFVREGGRCEYTATRPGGYRGEGLYEMWITRDGSTTYYNGAASGGPDPANSWCADTGFVHPGDHVVVSAAAPLPEDNRGVRSPITGNDPGTPPNPHSWLAVGSVTTCNSSSADFYH